MQTVKLENGVVREIIPEYALPVEKWYGTEFAVNCMEAPDDVKQGDIYDRAAKRFSSPVSVTPTPTAEEDVNAMAVDHEYRLTLLEMGVK